MSKALRSQLATGNKCIFSSASMYKNAGRGYFDLPYVKKCHMKVIYEDPRANQQEQKLDFNKSTNRSFMDGHLVRISEKIS